MSLLNLTGPPTIAYVPEGGGDPVEVELPLPHHDNWMQGVYGDESRFVQDEDGTEAIVGEPCNRARFVFGYRALGRATAEALIVALERRVVTFTPRTYLDGIDAPEAEAEVESFACRVVSPIPFTEHQQIRYQIDIELEATSALEMVEVVG